MEYTKTEDLISSLKESLGEKFNKEEAERFAAYCLKLKKAKKDGVIKNPWFQSRKVEELDQIFRRVLKEGLVFDGAQITLQSTGLSFDYRAYKNKMLLVYPESLIDLMLTYKEDKYSFKKVSGKVIYEHILTNPFEQSNDKIIGGYCIIKNKRGEFLTILSKERIEEHRAIAKTDFIWKMWFPEMCMKTLIKKATKYHFDDIFSGINEMDNENYDLESAGKTPVEKLTMKIVELLDVYQGEDKDKITLECKQAKKNKMFTLEFAEGIVKKLGGKI